MCGRRQRWRRPLRSWSDRETIEWRCLRCTNGTISRGIPIGRPAYVSEEELFPTELSDPFGIPVEQWETFDEPYKVCYRDYVETQRDKDISAYSVKSALARADFFKNASPHWKALLALHFKPDRLRRVPFRVRLRPHDPVLPRSGDAEHGDLRHPRRNASRPDPDVFRLRVHQARPGVRLGAQSRPRPRTGSSSACATRWTTSSTPATRSAPRS